MKNTFGKLTSLILLAVFSASRAAALQPNDWPTWGQNPQNTRSNPAETLIPSNATLTGPGIPWSFVPTTGFTAGNRWGIIADSYVLGSSVNPTTGSVATNLDVYPISGPPAFWSTVNIKNEMSFYPPSYSNGNVAWGFGYEPSTPIVSCAVNRGFAKSYVVSPFAAAWTKNTVISAREMYAGTADESSKAFYHLELCPFGGTGIQVRLHTTNINSAVTPVPGVVTPMLLPLRTNDHFTAFAPAVDAGFAYVPIGSPSPSKACPGPATRIEKMELATGANPCTIGPYLSAFDLTPPTVVGNRLYTVNFADFGPLAFDSSSCGPRGGAGKLGGKGLAAAGGFVFTAAAGILGDTIEQWDSDMLNKIATFTHTPGVAISPYIVEANGYLYGYLQAPHGRPFAVQWTPGGTFTLAWTGQANGQNGFLMAVGESSVVASSAGEVRVWNASTTPPPPSVTVVSLPPCVTNDSWLHSMDTVFDPLTGNLLDSRIEGADYVTNTNFSLTYDSLLANWVCTTAPVPPLGCNPLQAFGISLTDAGQGFAIATDCSPSSYQLLGGVWQPAVPIATPPPQLQEIHMIKGTSPQTGWAMGCGGLVYYDGANWIHNVAFCPAYNYTNCGSGFSWIMNMSFPRNDPTSGWTTIGADLLELTGPVPGTWVSLFGLQPYPNFPAAFGVWLNSATDRWESGAVVSFGSQTSQPFIAQSILAGTAPIDHPLPAIPAPFNVPTYCPGLADITFYENDTDLGVAVGGSFSWVYFLVSSPGFALVYITKDHGVNWAPLVLDLSPLTDVVLTKVRFVDANTAYAIGYAGTGAYVPSTPLLIKISL